MADKLSAIEEMKAAPVVDIVTGLGLAVAKANLALSNVPNTDILFTIPKAEIEINIAISINQQKESTIGGGFDLYGINVNAAYKSTYGFDEKASSRIRIELSAKPRETEKAS